MWIKSSYRYHGGCVEIEYRKSSASGNGGCVEVGRHTDRFYVRDSKDPDGPVLEFSRAEWMAFLAGATAGEFDF
jgi:hypothetical protein